MVAPMGEKGEAMDIEEVATQRCGEKRKSTTPISSSLGEPKARAQRRQNLFQEEWLKYDSFKGWLAPVEGDEYQAKCIACNTSFICGNAEVKRHSEEESHKENVNLFYSSNDIPVGVRDSEEIDRLWMHKDQVQSAERVLAEYMVKMDFDPQAANCFIHLSKKIVSDSAIAADLSVERCMALYTSRLPN